MYTVLFYILLANQGSVWISQDPSQLQAKKLETFWREKNQSTGPEDKAALTRHAESFFDFYLANPQDPVGKKSCQSAFILWVSTSNADAIHKAFDQIDPNDRLWGELFPMVINAYGNARRFEEGHAFQEDLACWTSNPWNLSRIYERQGRIALRVGEQKLATQAFQKIVSLNAGPVIVAEAETYLAEIGQLHAQAPNFGYIDLNGKTTGAEDYRGKVVLITFWATWCGPCKTEIPILKRLEKRYPEKLVLLGVSMDRDRETLQEFLNARQIKWSQNHEGPFTGPLAEMFHVTALPQNILIDPNGRVIGRYLRGEDLEKAVASLLETRN
jgi:thiol-disulfide isomerase/thioredoxin